MAEENENERERREFWDRFHEVWSRMEFYYNEEWNQFKSFTIITIRENFPLNNIKIPDLGCGNGDILSKIIRAGDDVHGIDLSQKAMDKTRQNIPRGEFMEGDLENPPLHFPDSEFGAVICTSNTFGMMNNREQLATEVHRILEPNGLFMLAIYNSEQINTENAFEWYGSLPEIARITEFDEETSTVIASEMCFSHWFSREEIRALLENAGFWNIKIHERGIGFVVIAEKSMVS